MPTPQGTDTFDEDHDNRRVLGFQYDSKAARDATEQRRAGNVDDLETGRRSNPLKRKR